MTITPSTTYRVGDRVRFVPESERHGDTARPDRLTAAHVGTVIAVEQHLDGMSRVVIEFDTPAPHHLGPARASVPASSLEAWPPADVGEGAAA